MSGPKIKVEADLSSFDAELNKLKSSIAQIGDQLKTSTGKAHFNFDGSQKELNALIHQAEKLTTALDKGNKTTVQYAKNLKAAQEAMANAAKVAAKLESAGDAKTNRASSYFRGYSGELTEDYHSASGQNAIQREQERTRARIEADRHASNTKWAGRAARFAGFIGGSVMGGGGGYATMGAGLGSMLPGPWGMVGGAVGGAIGGMADRTIGPAREEAKMYSELRRSLGSTTTDFDNLRDSVRSVVSGLAITDNEAANLAKQFARTASLSGDSTEAIARGVGTSGGFAQGYGISPDHAASFFASMRLTGNSNNDKDSRRLAMMIGESVQKGGTSARMDEVLSAVANFAAKSAQQTLTAPNVGQFSSYLSSLTGSGYAGIKGDPNSAAHLINRADDVVRGGGTMGEASQFHWLQARQSAFPGMSALDNNLMQDAGIGGNLADQFAPNSPAYDRAVENKDWKTVAHYDKLRKNIGGATNFKIGMEHIKAISHGDSNLENANFRGMFGGNSQQAAFLMMKMSQAGGVGGFEKQLSKFGVNIDNLDVSQLSAYSQLVGGGDEAFAKQYKKLAGKGNVPIDELNAASGLKGDEFKKAILELTKNYDKDDGLESQVTQIGISNKIQESTAKLVGIETDMREYLLRILDGMHAAGPVLDRAVSGFKSGAPMSGVSASGGKFSGSWADKHYLGAVDDALKNMAMTGSPSEKKRIYDEMMGTINKNPGSYPKEAEQWLRNGLGDDGAPVKKGSVLGPDMSAPTINADGSQSVVGMVRGKSPYDDMINSVASDVGIDPLVLKQIAAQESSLDPKADNGNDRGLMQLNKKYDSDRGVTNPFNPEQNLRAGAKFFKGLLDRSGGNYREAFRRYNGSGPDAERYADNSMATYSAIHDQLPGNHKASSGPRNGQASLHEFTHKITLHDSGGNVVADPLVFTHFGAPRAAGVS
ncbi:MULTISPECIES: transglycosylase SLT domain-containing protein [Methylobacter]